MLSAGGQPGFWPVHPHAPVASGLVDRLPGALALGKLQRNISIGLGNIGRRSATAGQNDVETLKQEAVTAGNTVKPEARIAWRSVSAYDCRRSECAPRTGAGAHFPQDNLSRVLFKQISILLPRCARVAWHPARAFGRARIPFRFRLSTADSTDNANASEHIF